MNSAIEMTGDSFVTDMVVAVEYEFMSCIEMTVTLILQTLWQYMDTNQTIA